jgi:hypothetical protein
MASDHIAALRISRAPSIGATQLVPDLDAYSRPLRGERIEEALTVITIPEHPGRRPTAVLCNWPHDTCYSFEGDEIVVMGALPEALARRIALVEMSANYIGGTPMTSYYKGQCGSLLITPRSIINPGWSLSFFGVGSATVVRQYDFSADLGDSE